MVWIQSIVMLTNFVFWQCFFHITLMSTILYNFYSMDIYIENIDVIYLVFICYSPNHQIIYLHILIYTPKYNRLDTIGTVIHLAECVYLKCSSSSFICCPAFLNIPSCDILNYLACTTCAPDNVWSSSWF